MAAPGKPGAAATFTMRKKDVQIGGRYAAKVSGQLTLIKILCPSNSGGWLAKNEKTHRLVHIKTAGRLRGKA